MTLRVVITVLAIIVSLSAVAWTCASADDEGPPDLAEVTQTEVPPYALEPLSFDVGTTPAPEGFASWDSYVSFVQNLRVGRAPGRLVEPARVTINADSTLTIVPAVVRTDDGSSGRWIVIVPNGAPVRFSKDGLVLLDLRESEYLP
jgi:hypothetical protein